MDHEEFLGKNIEKITQEKSGILKKDSEVIISKQNNSSFPVKAVFVIYCDDLILN